MVLLWDSHEITNHADRNGRSNQLDPVTSAGGLDARASSASSSLFDQMAERGLGLRQTGDVQRCPSNFVHGILSVDMEPVR